MNLKKSKYFTNTILNFIYRIINMAVSYISIPLTLKYLQNERYGIWQTILTIISWAGLSNFGIGNGLRNKVTECITLKNNKKLKQYIASAYIYLTLISFVILLVGIFMISFLNTNVLFKNTTVARNEIIISFIIVIFSFCLNFVLGISASIAYGIHKSSLVNLFQTITSFFTLGGIVLLRVSTSGNLIKIALVYLFANSISNVLFTSILLYNKKFRPSFRNYNKRLGKELTTLGLEFFILQIATIILFSTDNFIISIFIDVNKVTNYSITSKLFQIISTVFSILLIQLWSSVAEANIKKNYVWIKKAIYKLLILLIPTILVIIGVIFNFNFITSVWLGKKIYVSEELIILCAVYAFLICFNGIFVNVQNGMNRIRPQIFSSSFACVLNIPLAILLIKYFNMGINAVMLSNIISLSIMTIFSCIDLYLRLKKISEV